MEEAKKNEWRQKMKRTWKEVIDLIEQKKQSGYDALNHQTDLEARTGKVDISKKSRLVGEINAYQDVLCLIQSSGLMNDQNEKK